MTNEQIVMGFVEISVQQDIAILGNEIAKFTRLYSEKAALLAELKARPGDQRRLLVGLYRHPNLQVRLNAANATLALEPLAARAVLVELTQHKLYYQAGDAGMALWALDRGICPPT